MRSKQFLSGFLVVTVLVGVLASIPRSVAAKEPNAPDKISAELIGQVFNASPKISVQYGYVSYLSGVDTRAITGPSGLLSEQSALLTFYSDTATEQVLNNGPMRVIDRRGEVTFYLNTKPTGNFSDPESFRQGVVVMKAMLRHQVIINTMTNSFTAHFDCIITSTEPFMLNGKTYQLSQPGQPFAITFSGHLNQNGPPSGFMAGFVTGLELQFKSKSLTSAGFQAIGQI